MKAVIFGINGQDGSLLAHHLIGLNIKVVGVSSQSGKDSTNLIKLNCINKITIRQIDYLDGRSVKKCLINEQPEFIYFLAGQTSVGESFKTAELTQRLNLEPVRQICEYLMYIDNKGARFLNACSSEMFGNQDGMIKENSRMVPVSPYGISKAMAFETVVEARIRLNIFAVNCILFNHESILRPNKFFFGKVLSHLKSNKEEILTVGNIDVIRDIGWANEYVVGMQKMLQHSEPDDIIIATGCSTSLRNCVEILYDIAKIETKDRVVVDAALVRPDEIQENYADIAKCRRILNWVPKVKYRKLMNILAEQRLT